ncbi:MAG: nitrogenase component 1 [Oscillospiraceae bacterium]
MKELQQVKRLSAVKSGTGIRFLSPAVSPGCHCPMRMAAITAHNIRGLSSLLVGMPECTTHVRLFNPKPEGKHGELNWLYVLDSHEVVFGARNGLINALKKMDKAGAKAILLIVTCVPELVGEDFEGIIREIQPEIAASLACVMLGQFKNFSYPPGYWKTMEAMGAMMGSQKTDARRINVLGRSPKEEHIPMPPLLPQLQQRGLALRCLAPGASLEDFRLAPDAALNLVVSPYVQPLAARMEREFGIPYIALHSLYAVEQIDEAFQEISQRFGFVWNGEFDGERSQALALEGMAAKKLNGLSYVSATGIDLPLVLAGYLAGFGMEPLLLHMEEFYPEDKRHAAALLALGQNPPICRMVNLTAELPLLEELSPAMCIGNLARENKNIPCAEDMYDLYGQVGYSRTSALLQRILNVKPLAAAVKRGEPVYGTSSV